MSCHALGLYKEPSIAEANPREPQEALSLIHISTLFAALIVCRTLSDRDIDAVPADPETDVVSESLHAVHNPEVSTSLGEAISSPLSGQEGKYDVEEEEIADDDFCEFTDEQLDEAYCALSPRARGWQRIRSNWLKERAIKRAACLARSPPLPLSFSTPLHSVHRRRPALSIGKRSMLRESFTPDDLVIADGAAEAEAETDTYPQEEDQASFFKSYLESRNGTQSMLFTY